MRRGAAAVVAALAVVACLPVGAAADTGKPADRNAVSAPIVRTEQFGVNWERVYVESAAMNRTVAVDVLHGSGEGPRPTLYLLDGVDAERVSDWLTKGSAAAYFADKPVDVVLPSGGTGSMYSDWLRPDAALGWNRWETFLTAELPGTIESYIHSDGRRAVAGVSMGAQGAMMLAHRHPGLYKAAAGMSGCYSTVDGTGSAVTTMTVASRGGNVVNLWGPPGTLDWLTHDSTVGAEALRGMVIYLSAASGIPNGVDLTDIAQSPDIATALQTIGGGVALEAGSRLCTDHFAQRLDHLGIPATVHYEPSGIHAWTDFATQLAPAWEAIATAFAPSGGS
ncbi:alpha/beta hydrolase family protein [Nocardia sp. NPDC051030]|uniref:alpha/beta hydrolase n=1 Tax=Nocardia sp. NPDC051030 TaxID=3155162 RepID=UPI003443059B